MREIALGLTAALAVAGCAATNASHPSTTQTVYQPPAPMTPNAFTEERAPLHSQLFACNGGGGSNIGETGFNAEVVRYTPYVMTPAGALSRNPTQGACLSSGFGWRGRASGGGRQHNGLDLANRAGGFIYAAGDGWISNVGWLGGYGQVIEIDHGRNVRTLYAHMSEVDPNLRSGMPIRAGVAIGRMGMTGNATGVHLHYEIFVDGVQIDPLGNDAEHAAMF